MTAAPVPAADLAELLRLIDRLLSEEAVAPAAERYRGVGVDAHQAGYMALGVQATRLRSLLAGLLSNQAGGVTPNGVQWAVQWLRTELDRAT